ncbi:FMN-dependent NADH-azoreductase [Chryseobacterium sp. H1D6B]|uniref:FMN-dependent NADH-azoreductase n=1 Tax=Chryseobacterium sp. H1D6B TaxID=2940588 RepID=UPI0015C94E2F|nr:NAD(P)H-dependent oxidoreductase [Chryseobacterium sp. H1D6B]MDH6253366.1 FMN-dependent NADH-azoreductase [Chryseobacterium sp. H1D6B]
MTTLLRIDSSLRITDSYSRSMGDYFIRQWKKKHPEGSVIQRDVAQRQLPHLNQETVTCFFDDTAYSENIQLSDEFIDELYKSDGILITCPMYNYGISSSLKAYFDHVVRTKRTFTYDNGIKGLLLNKKASIISTMGNLQSLTGELNPMEIHLTSILNQLGITDISYFPLDGMIDPKEAGKKIEFQQSRIDECLIHELV